MATLTDFTSKSILQTTIAPTKTFIWNPMDTWLNQQKFYDCWFPANMTNFQHPWNAFFFNVKNVPSVDIFEMIQQWLDNRDRMALWDKQCGYFCQCNSFNSLLFSIGGSTPYVTFVHFKLDLNRIATFKSIIFGSLSTIMNDVDVILCIHTTPRYKKWRYTSMNFVLQKHLFLSTYYKGKIGSAIKWCNHIIPHCLNVVNNILSAEICCRYPFKCATQKEIVSMCSFITYF